jgi:hypothetical protein
VLLLWIAVAIMPSLARAQVGGASMAGAVVTDSSERPIAGAEIAIAELKLAVRSDSTGSFVLAGIPAGRYVVTVRAVGYAAISTGVIFARGQRVNADLVLSPAAQSLAKVDVKATASTSGKNPRIAEFDERRKMGFGKFLTQDVFEKAEGRKLGEVLVQRVAGVRTLGSSNRMLVATRGVNSPRQGICPVQVIIDDIVQNSSTGAAGFDIDSIDPDRIAAVEFYTVSNRPAQFNRGGAPCGTLVIWTRW